MTRLKIPRRKRFSKKALRESRFVWTTKEGKKIPIEKMPDSHLLNSILFMERQAEDLKTAVLYDSAILMSHVHGEHAKDALDIALDEMMQDPAHIFVMASTPYRQLVREAAKRRIMILLPNEPNHTGWARKWACLKSSLKEAGQL